MGRFWSNKSYISQKAKQLNNSLKTELLCLIIIFVSHNRFLTALPIFHSLLVVIFLIKIVLSYHLKRASVQTPIYLTVLLGSGKHGTVLLMDHWFLIMCKPSSELPFMKRKLSWLTDMKHFMRFTWSCLNWRFGTLSKCGLKRK